MSIGVPLFRVSVTVSRNVRRLVAQDLFGKKTMMREVYQVLVLEIIYDFVFNSMSLQGIEVREIGL